MENEQIANEIQALVNKLDAVNHRLALAGLLGGLSVSAKYDMSRQAAENLLDSIKLAFQLAPKGE